MIEAIIALVGAVVGVVGGVLQSGAQKFAIRNAEYEAAIQFQRDKETALYGALGSQQQTNRVIIIAGVIGLIVLVYFLYKSNKK